MKINFRPMIELRTAHDVRKLHCCTRCGRIGDMRYMPVVDGKLYHAGCALQKLGVKGLLALPRTEQNKCTLGEIGMKAMKKLVEAR